MMSGNSVHTWKVNKDWFDVDSISNILQANRTLLAKEIPTTNGIYIPDGDTFETGEKLVLDSGIQISSGVTIRGPTIIARDSTVGPNSEIGPHVSIGQGTEIKGGCFISEAVIFGRTELAHNTRLSRVVAHNNRVFTE
jgi:NDP-sugar pyrophosphorylase family protein